MTKANAFYAQSGGVTAVINATACGVLQTAAEHKDVIGKVLVGANGIVGALNEDLLMRPKKPSDQSLGCVARRVVPSARVDTNSSPMRRILESTGA